MLSLSINEDEGKTLGFITLILIPVFLPLQTLSKVQATAISAIFARISQQGNMTDARKSSFLVSKKVLTVFFFAPIQALGFISSDFVTLETQLLLLPFLGLFKVATVMSFLGPLACVFVLPLLPRLQADGAVYCYVAPCIGAFVMRWSVTFHVALLYKKMFKNTLDSFSPFKFSHLSSG